MSGFYKILNNIILPVCDTKNEKFIKFIAVYP